MAHLSHLILGAGKGTRTPLTGLEGRDNSQLYDTRIPVLPDHFIRIRP